jgi:hypothetical protein
MDAGTVLLAIIGIGIIVVGVLILMDRPPAATREVVVERRGWPWRRGGWGPYYSHLPVRPLVY